MPSGMKKAKIAHQMGTPSSRMYSQNARIDFSRVHLQTE
jgi:hypothetical protein